MDTNFFNASYIMHELRNRMNIISSAIELLETSDLTAYQSNLIGKMKFAHESMSRISEDLLELHKMEICNRKHNLYSLVAGIGEQASGTINSQGLDFACDLSIPSDKVVMIDKLRLEQIIFNFLDNAIKFTKVGAITLSAGLLEESAENILFEISVIDTGIGIDPGNIDRIFEYGVTSGRGNGIGLYACHCIALSMNGTLSVESTPDVGSIFKVMIKAEKA